MNIKNYNIVVGCIKPLIEGLNIELKLLKKRNITKAFCDGYTPSCYSIDKALLIKLFKNTSSINFQDVYTRLLALDSTYSTQMTRRYYGIGELAETIYLISNSRDFKRNLKAFAKNPESIQIFDYEKKNLKLFVDNRLENSNLFDENFGIGKTGEDKGVATSLISKYAYFETKFGFPIYDSIANKVGPIIWKYCGEDEKDKIYETSNIQEYIRRINKLKSLFRISYDELDCFLWHLGKLMRINLSLIFSMEEYCHISSLKSFVPTGDQKIPKEKKISLLTDIANTIKTKNNKPFLLPTIELAITLLKEGWDV